MIQETSIDMIKEDSALGLEEDIIRPSLDPEREVRSERKKRRPKYLEDYE